MNSLTVYRNSAVTDSTSPVLVTTDQVESLNAAAVPVQPGTQTIQASVRVTWIIQ